MISFQCESIISLRKAGDFESKDLKGILSQLIILKCLSFIDNRIILEGKLSKTIFSTNKRYLLIYQP